MIIEELEQRTPEWLQMRVGCCTGSRIIDVTKRLQKASNGKKAGDYAKAHDDYMWELVCERLTGRSMDHYVTPYMEDGIQNEPLARAAYEIATNFDVRPVGLAMHPSIKWFASSPDSLVGNDGLLEIKCLKSNNHLDIVRSGQIPEEYMPQMMAEMACAEREWCDFVAFDPLMPPKLQLFGRRFYRDDKLIAMMESEVESFLAEVEETLQQLQQVSPTQLLLVGDLGV